MTFIDSKRPSITEKSLSRTSSQASSAISVRSRSSVSSTATSIASAAPSFLSQYSFSSRRSSAASGARDLIDLDPAEQARAAQQAVGRVYQWEKVLSDPNIEPTTVPYTRIQGLQLRLLQETDREAYAAYLEDGISSMNTNNTLSESSKLAMPAEKFMLDFEVTRKSRPPIKCCIRLSHCSINENCAEYINNLLHKSQSTIRRARGSKVILPVELNLDPAIFTLGLGERRASSAMINTLRILQNSNKKVSKAFVTDIHMPNSHSATDDMATFAAATWTVTVGIPKKTATDALSTVTIPWSVLDVSQAFPDRLYKATDQQRKDWFGPQKQTGSRRYIVLKVTDIRRDTTNTGIVLSAKLHRQAGPGISIYQPAPATAGRRVSQQPAAKKSKGGWLNL